jgi:hypothetical protein
MVYLIMMPLDQTTAPNIRVMSDWKTWRTSVTTLYSSSDLNMRQPAPACFVQHITVWATNVVEQTTIKHTDTAHTKAISVTMLQYGHIISMALSLWRKARFIHLWTLTIRINFIRQFWKDWHPAILEDPLWCIIQSMFSRAQGHHVCSVSLQPLCEQITHPCLSDWKHWCACESTWPQSPI